MAKDAREAGEMRYRYGADRRLKKRDEFSRVFSDGISAADGRLVVYGCPNGREKSRIGLSVGKKLGIAVQRNRYKRTLREAFRLRQHELPSGFDYVLIPRRGQQASVRLYGESLVHLCGKLGRRNKGGR